MPLYYVMKVASNDQTYPGPPWVLQENAHAAAQVNRRRGEVINSVVKVTMKDQAPRAIP